MNHLGQDLGMNQNWNIESMVRIYFEKLNSERRKERNSTKNQSRTFQIRHQFGKLMRGAESFHGAFQSLDAIFDR